MHSKQSQLVSDVLKFEKEQVSAKLIPADGDFYEDEGSYSRSSFQSRRKKG